MKISIISTLQAGDWGGSEELLREFAEYVMKEDHDFVVSKYSLINLLPEKLYSLSEHIKFRSRFYILINKTIRYFSMLVNRENQFEIALKIAGILNFINPYRNFFNKNVDFVLINQGRSYDLIDDPFLMRMVRKKTNKQFLICHWNLDYSRPEVFSYKENRLNFKSFNAVFFVSKRSKQTTERQLAVEFKNAIVIKNPINRADDNYITYPSTDSGFRLACVATLSSLTKGQDVLLEVLKAEKWKKRNLKLFLYGKGQEEEYYRELIELYGLNEKVFFGGFRKVEEIWQENHLLVMPSISEGLPLSLVEAMISGRAAVVTHIAGMPEIVSEGRNGFISEAPKDIFLDQALERAWERREDWNKIGQNARETALSFIEKQPGKKLFEIIQTNLK